MESLCVAHLTIGNFCFSDVGRGGVEGGGGGADEAAFGGNEQILGVTVGEGAVEGGGSEGTSPHRWDGGGKCGRKRGDKSDATQHNYGGENEMVKWGMGHGRVEQSECWA